MIENSSLPLLGQVQGQTVRERGRPLHVLTLTPFYPSGSDDAAGCFVAEPLAALAGAGVVNTVFAVQPFYRAKPSASSKAVPARWLRYFSLPGGFGLPTAGAFLFARIVGRVRELQRLRQVDLIHAHAPLPCGRRASRSCGMPRSPALPRFFSSRGS